MEIKNIVWSFILLFSVLGCETKKEEFELEKTVFTQILPSLVDSICVDSRLVQPPPMLGEYVTDKNGHVFVDSTKSTNEQKVRYAKWEKLKLKAQQDTSSVFIAFDPLLKKAVYHLNKKLLKKYPISDFSLKGKDTIDSFVLDFDRIRLNSRFKLKNISEFLNTDKHNYLLFEYKYDFIFSGILYVSRIQFDKERKKGVLEASFDYCGRCGRGYYIYIKNVNGIWIIEKLENTWVS
ncbi:hypothetical protein ABS764_10780 [Flavobacterium sp. ST-87]|uniref:Lipoprotein n=1 Tax=Flavobacterium plantiphilum TaxID=3163297 RepID=A0ABW8XVY6_9FLAO